jgi:carbonic anhydrase
MQLKPQRSIKAKKAYTIIPIAIIATLALAVGARSASAERSVPADVALQQLLDGNKLYVADHTVRPAERPSDAEQHPKAVILSCSDSRLAPTILFDQGIGALFVVRTAGNTYDPLVLDSIEYSIEHLGTRLIVVLGHDQCGAVKAAVATYPKPTKSVLLKNIYPAVKKTKGLPGDAVSNAVDENAELIAKKLAMEPEFAPMIASGELKIVPARYHLATGSVTLLPEK